MRADSAGSGRATPHDAPVLKDEGATLPQLRRLQKIEEEDRALPRPHGEVRR